ncbi:MAG: steroid-24-oyl-CoA synthetase, partial [Solirubrobacteraceae bacterium]|nr:steroid-24-oyl-CoA synthetase [Solirubrobacteraceae bacterium]
QEIYAQLTGPGGPFEVVVEEVNGRPTEVYKERMRSLGDILAIARARGDDNPYIVQGDRRIGFETFVDTAYATSAGLAELGVGHGDRVAVLAQNCPEWCLAFWGSVGMGAVLVGLNGWWKADEIVYGLQDSGAKVLVADRKRLERVVKDLDECPDLEHVLLVDCDPKDLGLDGDSRVRRFDDLVTTPTSTPPTATIAEDDPATILYTSGTTGRPKGAVSTHRNMIANLQNTLFSSVSGAMLTGNELIPTGGQTVSLFTSPLFHVSGLHSGVVVGLLAGLRLVMIEGRFDPIKAFEIIQDEGVTIWATVPTMVWRACEHPARHDYDTSSVRTVGFGGSPSADELQRMVRETFPNVKGGSNAYGLTETSSVATVLSPQESVDRPDSVGRPVPTVRIRIADDLGGDVPIGETGEVLITGPTLMAGYWGKPEATAESIRDGWLHTGDIGRLDDEGYLFITDRKKDMIIRGGENIYCVEIENRLVEHPSIADAAVIGVAHPELGEEVKAVVQVEPGHTITEDEVRQWVRETLAGFKVPAYVEIREEKLPRNASGKLLKNVLRGSGDVSFAETM